MIPATYNLPDAYRGDNYGPITLKIKDSNGAYIDFRNAKRVDLHVKNKKNYANVLDWSTEDGTIDITADSLILKEKIGCKMGMPPGIYNYDLQILNNKNLSTYLMGTLSVSGDTTEIIFCDCEFAGGSAAKLSNNFCSMESSFSFSRV
jgi:hypothetical protein